MFNIAKGTLKVESPNPNPSAIDKQFKPPAIMYTFSVAEVTDLLPKVYEKVLSSNQVEYIKQLYMLSN